MKQTVWSKPAISPNWNIYYDSHSGVLGLFLCLSPLKASSLTLPLNSGDEIEPEFNDASDIEEDLVEGEDDMQTFVFSATLSKDLQRNVKKRTRPKGAWDNKNKISSTLGLLFDL
jgi:hypothetical protein